MRACYYILLLLAVVLLASTASAVSRVTVSKQTKLANAESLDALQLIDTASTHSNDKRFLRIYQMDDEEEQADSDDEERGITFPTKTANRLKNWLDGAKKKRIAAKKEELTDLLMQGENSFETLYSKKTTPFAIFTTLDLSKKENANSAVHDMWSKYLTYWANRNIQRGNK